MRLRRVAPVLLLLLLAAGSVALAAAYRSRDDHRRAEVRSARATEALGIVQRAVAHTLDAQKTLSIALDNLSGPLDGPTWRRLAQPVLANAAASSASWVEQVGFAEREAWERRNGGEIRQLSPQGRPVRAGAHANYLVAVRVAARQVTARGIDLGVDATRRAHMQWAARTGRPSATPPLTLLGRPARRGVVVYAPVKRPDGRVGWVMVVYRTHRLAEILKHRIMPGTRISAADAGHPIFGPLGLKGQHTRVAVGQRTWDLVAAAPLPAASTTAAFVLAVGLLLTLLVGGALLAASRREHRALERADDSEKQMAEVLSMLGEGVTVFRADGSIPMINERGRELLGVPAGERSISALDERWTWLGEDGEPLSLEQLPAHQVASAGGSIEGFLSGVVTPDGTFRWLRCSVRALPSEDGAAPYPVACSFEDVTAQREAEDALAASEERYRTVVDQLEEGVILQDTGSQIVTCNDAAHRILGLTRDQLEGRTSLDPHWHAVHADGSPWPGEEHPAPVALRTGEPQLRQMMGVHKPDGTLTWITINARPLRHRSDDEPHAVVCSFVEVTDSERQRVELEDAQRVAALGSWQVELSDPAVTTCSAGLKRLLGHRADVDMESFDAHLVRVVEEDRPLVCASYEALLTTGAEQDILYRARRADDGRLIVVHARARAERDHDGRICRLHGTLQDVTEQRSAERALRASEARFRGLAEHAPVAILETDPDGGCAWVNDAWEKMAGIDLTDAVGEGWLAAIDPADRELVAEAWDRARHEQATIPVEYRFAQPGGRRVIAMGTVAALRDESGGVTGLISVAADVTASREAERMRREAERHFRSAFQNAPIGVAVISLDGYFVGVNRAHVRADRLPAGAARGNGDRHAHPSRGRGARRRGDHRDARRRRGLLPGREPLHPLRRPHRLDLDDRDARARRRRPAHPLHRPGPGRDRASALRAAPAVHGRPRSADRAAQPPLVREGARPPRRARAALRRPGRGARARPRPLQGGQRHARPQRGRQADRRHRPPPALAPARVRRRGAAGRRRVRRAAAERRPLRGQGGGRRPARGHPRPGHPQRHPRPSRVGEHRRRGRQGPRGAHRRGPARLRRPGDVRRQGRRPRPRRRVRDLPARAGPDRGTTGLGRADQGRAGERGLRPARPADRRPRHRDDLPVRAAHPHAAGRRRPDPARARSCTSPSATT